MDMEISILKAREKIQKLRITKREIHKEDIDLLLKDMGWNNKETIM